MSDENVDPKFRDFFRQVKEEYPHLNHISIHYYGSGDDFGDFNNVQAIDYNGKYVEIAYKFIHEHNDSLYMLVEEVGADFDNDGSEGVINLDLKNGKVTVNNFSIFHDSVPDGTLNLDIGPQ